MPLCLRWMSCQHQFCSSHAQHPLLSFGQAADNTELPHLADELGMSRVKCSWGSTSSSSTYPALYWCSAAGLSHSQNMRRYSQSLWEVARPTRTP